MAARGGYKLPSLRAGNAAPSPGPSSSSPSASPSSLLPPGSPHPDVSSPSSISSAPAAPAPTPPSAQGSTAGVSPSPSSVPLSSSVDQTSDTPITKTETEIARPARHSLPQQTPIASDSPQSSTPAQANGAAPPDQNVQSQVCGVGILFTQDGKGENKITKIVPGSPAASSGRVRVGDILVKVNGYSVVGKSVSEIVSMIQGQQGTRVEISLTSSESKSWNVVSAPFQELPFDYKKDRSSKKTPTSKGRNEMLPGQRMVFGGGTLPPGFEHLESLRTSQPYTQPCVSLRKVVLVRHPLKIEVQK